MPAARVFTLLPVGRLRARGSAALRNASRRPGLLSSGLLSFNFAKGGHPFGGRGLMVARALRMLAKRTVVRQCALLTFAHRGVFTGRDAFLGSVTRRLSQSRVTRWPATATAMTPGGLRGSIVLNGRALRGIGLQPVRCSRRLARSALVPRLRLFGACYRRWPAMVPAPTAVSARLTVSRQCVRRIIAGQLALGQQARWIWAGPVALYSSAWQSVWQIVG